MKAVLRGKCLVLKAYVRKERFQTNNLSSHFKKLKIARTKETQIKMKKRSNNADEHRNQVENRKTLEKIIETKNSDSIKRSIKFINI